MGYVTSDEACFALGTGLYKVQHYVRRAGLFCRRKMVNIRVGLFGNRKSFTIRLE